MARLYRVGEVARIARITVRTLHHWDEIGLLSPSGRSSGGYRLYGDADLLRLQQIQIRRSLGLSLEQIRRVLDDPDFDPRLALLEQRELLAARVDETRTMIAAIDAALHLLDHEGGRPMKPEDLFEGFDPTQFETEARQRWGGTEAHREASRRTSTYGKDDWARIRDEEASLLAELAEALAAGRPATDPATVALAERHRLHIDRWYYPCSHATHAALGEMYLTDPRFSAHFDRHGPGLAEYLVAAIRENHPPDGG